MEIILTNLLKLTLITISFAATYAICRYANSKTREINASTHYSYDNILWKIENIVENCVIETNETFVKQLKADGAFTEEKQIEAFNKTFETVFSELSASVLELMEEEGVNIANLVTTLIEKQVKSQKKLDNYVYPEPR